MLFIIILRHCICSSLWWDLENNVLFVLVYAQPNYMMWKEWCYYYVYAFYCLCFTIGWRRLLLFIVYFDIAQLYHMMGRRVVPITIMPAKHEGDEPLCQSGVVIECRSKSAYIITDPCQLVGKIGVNDIVVTFPGGQKIHPRPEHFLIRNVVVGIACHGLSDANLVEKFEIYNRPLRMFQEVRVYEAVTGEITKGNITWVFHEYTRNQRIFLCHKTLPSVWCCYVLLIIFKNAFFYSLQVIRWKSLLQWLCCCLLFSIWSACSHQKGWIGWHLWFKWIPQ